MENISYIIDINAISIKNFCKLGFWEKNKIKNIVDKNYQSHFQTAKNSGGFNFPIEDDENLFFEQLYQKFLLCSKDIFGNFKLSNRNSKKCFCYRGNKDDMGIRYDYWWHNHVHSSTINSVYYLQVHNDGISFKKDNLQYDYLPEDGELLIFPSTLIHAPQPNRSKKYRYSINMEIITEESVDCLFSRIF